MTNSCDSLTDNNKKHHDISQRSNTLHCDSLTDNDKNIS